MNETLDLLGRRRSLPPIGLAGPGPDFEQLSTLLKLAARVPDHGKLAPWRFVVIEGEGRERLGRLALEIKRAAAPDLDDAAVQAELTRFARAPLVVAVVSRAAPHIKIPEWEQVLSAGAVCMNLIVAAKAMGFASTWVTEWCAYDATFRERLGLGAFEKIAGFVHIGRATFTPRRQGAPDDGRDRQPIFVKETRSMFYEPRERDKNLLPHDPFKAIVTPRPIGWISTRALDGRVNLAPYSFFNAFSSSPAIVGFSSEGMKDSASFAIESGEFVANLASFDLFQPMSETSAPLPRGQSEFEHAGLTMAACRLVKAPRVAEAHAALECKIVEIIQLRTHAGAPMDNHLVLGEVVGVHIDEAMIKDGRFDTAGAKPLGRCGYQDYAVVDRLIALQRPRGGGDAAAS